MKRLLTIGHSYVVTLNRQLVHELARAAEGRWDVVAVAPKYWPGGKDFGPIALERRADEPTALEPADTVFSSDVRLFAYGSRLRALLREPWDVVHCWEEPFVVAGAQVCWWTPRKTPFVFYTMQNIAKSYPFPFQLFDAYCYRRCAGWLAVGETTAETGERRGHGSKPHSVTPLGVSLEHFRPDADARRATLQDLEWTDDVPVVGFLGRFVREKGLSVLMAALDMQPAPWRALVVGGGPLERELRDWAGRYGGHVRIVTGVAHDAVPRYLNAMDLLVAPSQTCAHWREQQGRMIIEAFACGVPVVASCSGEIPHVIADAGVILPESDVHVWAEAIAELLEERKRRDDLACKGLERARTHYSWAVIAHRYWDFFESLL